MGQNLPFRKFQPEKRLPKIGDRGELKTQYLHYIVKGLYLGLIHFHHIREAVVFGM